LLARIEDDVVEQVVSDHISFPFGVVNELGVVVWNADADPFGQIGSLFEGTSDYDPLRRYPGQWAVQHEIGSALNGIIYNMFRWYQPSWGGYTQADPVGLDGGINLYRYAAGNPLRFTDPNGLRAKIDDGRLRRYYDHFKGCFPLFQQIVIPFEEPGGVTVEVKEVGLGSPMDCNYVPLPSEDKIFVHEGKSCERLLRCLFHEFYEKWSLTKGEYRYESAGGSHHKAAAHLSEGAGVPVEKCCECPPDDE